MKKIKYNNLFIKNLDFWGILIGLTVIIGLTGPWLIKDSKSYDLNDSTRKIILSPFYSSIVREGRVITTLWFISLETFFSGMTLLLTSILYAFKFNGKWINFILFNISFLGYMFFFGSLGRGLSIGVLTFVGWGLFVTTIGIMLMFTFSLVKLIKG